MTLRFAYTRPDGGTSIVNAAPKEHIERGLPEIEVETEDGLITSLPQVLSQEEYVAFVRERSIPKDATNVVQLADDHVLPERDELRNAWAIKNGKIIHDMPKAREIWRNKMREARAPRLAALDVEYQRADETGDAKRKSEIANAKQALRDVTKDKTIDEAKDVAALKGAWPSILS